MLSWVKKVICITPNEIVQSQWKKEIQERQSREEKEGLDVGFVFYDDLKEEDFGETIQCVICDEAHNLSRVLDGKPELLEKIGSVEKRLLFTGTLLYDSIDNLLYAVNIAAGKLSTENSFSGWLLPFTELGLRRSGFYKTKKIKSIFLGYITAIMTFQILNSQLGSKLCDVADFYADNIPEYKKRKDKIIRGLLKYVPVADVTKFTPKTPFGESFTAKTIISTILYYSMSSPFSGIIPLILSLIMIKNPDDLDEMQEQDFFKKISNYIGYGFLTKETQVFEGFSKESAENLFGYSIGRFTSKTKLCELLTEIDGDSQSRKSRICSVRIGYSSMQAETFVRFATGRLTQTEMKLLGMTTNWTDYMQRQIIPEPDDLRRFGLQIGNLAYTLQEKAAIIKENKQAIRLRMNMDGLAAATTDSQSENGKGSDIIINPKFEDIIKVIDDKKYNRVVIYSAFEQGTKNFKTYAQSKKKDWSFGELNQEINGKKSGNESKDPDWFKRLFEDHQDAKPRIILLAPELTEGVDNIKDTDAMFVMEPIDNYSKLLQLRARVMRKNSHSQEFTDSKKVLTYYEYRCTLKFFERNFLNRFAWKNWWQHQAKVFYLIATSAFSQSSTPDEIIFKKLETQKGFETRMNAYLEKHSSGDKINRDRSAP